MGYDGTLTLEVEPEDQGAGRIVVEIWSKRFKRTDIVHRRLCPAVFRKQFIIFRYLFTVPFGHSIFLSFTVSEAYMKNIENPYKNAQCFFCSPNNPDGLKLKFQETETEPHEFVCERMRESQVVSKRLR